MPQASAPDITNSLLGTVIQCGGVLLLAILSLFLNRSIRRPFLTYWAAGWTGLAAALGGLYLSFRLPRAEPWLETVYFLGEYAFLFLLVAGVRNFGNGERLARGDLPAVVGATVLAAAFPRVGQDFGVRFVAQAGILAAGFAFAFTQLERARRRKGSSPGIQVMSVALVLLTLDFAQYVPVLTYAAKRNFALPIAYSAYTAIYDLLFEMVLGFGMVIVVMEDAHDEMERANQELREARDRLETLARVDPLTESLNRHAFYSMVEARRIAGDVAKGCVAVVDVDSLKPLNDSLGHAAGDAAIRAVARAIRGVVRADDPVFRWGGDEFLVLLVGVSEDEARERLGKANAALSRTAIVGAPEPVALTVSVGVASFSPGHPLDRAIEIADDAMYAAKQARKAAG